MKKSLKVIATATLAFSMFASVAMAAETTTTTTPTAVTTAAAVKTSKDFTDLAGKDAALLAKIDALLAKGFMDGKSDTTFDIEGNMTRAEAAKLVAKIFNLTVGTETTSSFKDVDGTDASQAWAIPFIEAAKKAGIIDGMTDTTFAPKDNVTLGQLATLLVKGFGKAADVKTTTPWYQGYLDVAKAAGIDLGTDGAKLATRGDLVVGSFAADAAVQAQYKLSVTEAKATGVYKVQVSFNKAVDTTKSPVLAIKKGTQVVTGTPTWSDDKKTATIATDTKISAGEYTVTLSGLDAATVDKTTATFKAEDESVSKLDFLSANDTLAFTKNAVIKIKAANQYGEATSLSPSSFTALVSGTSSTPTKDSDGNLVVAVDVKGTPGLSQGNGLIPVTVFLNNSAVTVTKNFKVGVTPILSKIETGKVTYPTGKTKLSASGDTASVALKLYDQYGNDIVQSQFTAPVTTPATLPEISITSINPIIAPYDENISVVKTDGTAPNYTFGVADLFDTDGNARVQVKLTNKLNKNADFTLNIYGGSSSATATVSASAGNLPVSISFDSFTGVVAAGDGSVTVPFTALDANGNKLTAQDIADAAAATPSKFNFTASGSTGYTVIQTGSDKGKVKFTLDTALKAGNTLYISGQVNQSTTNTYVTTTIPVQEARYPDHVAVVTEPTAKAILGANSDVRFIVRDQYNSDYSGTGLAIAGTNGQSSDYQVKVSVTADAGITLQTKVVSPAVTAPVADGSVYSGAGSATGTLATFNQGFYIDTTGTTGKITVKAVVQKKATTSGTFSDASATQSRTLEAVAADTALTYSLNTVGALYAATDKIAGLYKTDATTGVLSTTDKIVSTPLVTKVAKKLGLTAKDSAGNTVALPDNYIQSLSSSNSAVLKVDSTVVDAPQTPPVAPTHIGNGYVLGGAAGTATVTAIVYTNKGATISLSQDITVTADAVAASTLTAGRTAVTLDSTSLAYTYAYEFFTKDATTPYPVKLKLVDNYGIGYENDAITTNDALLGLRYTVNVTNGQAGGITVNPVTGVVSGLSNTNVKEFVITATTPNGKSVSVTVSR